MLGTFLLDRLFKTQTVHSKKNDPIQGECETCHSVVEKLTVAAHVQKSDAAIL